MSNQFRAKRPRLHFFSYEGCYRYFLTLCTERKREIFIQRDIVASIIDILKLRAAFEGFIIWAYCFMPDHLHLLAEGTHDKASLKAFIAKFKQISGYQLKKEHGCALWQKSYYDHVLRSDEDIITVCQYIWANPVRKGFVQNCRDYPYSGSLVANVWDSHR